MELSVQDNQLKQLIKTALVEVLTERQDLFVEIVREVMEDYGIGKAIKEGIADEEVSREEIFQVFSQVD